MGNKPSGPARDLWIEIPCQWQTALILTSGPARDLWIEIYAMETEYRLMIVGSRKGPVD